MNQHKARTRSGGRKGRTSKKTRTPARPLEPSTTPPEIENFAHWALGAPIHGALTAMDIHKPTPIQALTIGPILENRDVIAKAETGTGKTLAFGAPIMAKIDPSRKSVLALVMCPTRELSEQVHKVLAELGRTRGVRVALIVGGEEMKPQVDALQGGAQVVVGTPGRLLDLMRQGFLSFPWTEYVVLDEADKMLEIGFLPDVEKILAATPEERCTLLFSATFPDALLSLARRATREPVEVATASGVATVDTIAQYYVEVGDEERVRALSRLIEKSAPKDVFLIFLDRRTDVDRLMRRMERERFSVKSLHGGYDQAARFRVMTAFRAGEVKALLATDVASRGLDVEHVTHVINFSAPRDFNDYTHRIGRTGRAGRSGTSITFVPPIARARWRAIQRALPWDVQRLEDMQALGGEQRGRAERAERAERSNGRARHEASERPQRKPRAQPHTRQARESAAEKTHETPVERRHTRHVHERTAGKPVARGHGAARPASGDAKGRGHKSGGRSKRAGSGSSSRGKHGGERAHEGRRHGRLDFGAGV